MKTSIIPFQYNREAIEPGILHIGVGNFHRAHEQFYTNLLLEDTTQQGWGVCGAMLLPSDEHLYRALKQQDNTYTLTVCGRDGMDEVYHIGSLVELIWAVESPRAVIDRIADRNIRIITLTITEGGYNLDKAKGSSSSMTKALYTTCVIHKARKRPSVLLPKGYANGRLLVAALLPSFRATTCSTMVIPPGKPLPLSSKHRTKNWLLGLSITSLSRIVWSTASRLPPTPMTSFA